MNRDREEISFIFTDFSCEDSSLRGDTQPLSVTYLTAIWEQVQIHGAFEALGQIFIVLIAK